MSVIKDLPDLSDDLINEFYTYARQAVRRYKNMVVKANVDSDDIVQDVVLRSARYYPKFRGDCKLRSWVYLICRSHLINCVNRRRFDQDATITSSLSDQQEFEDGGGNPMFEEYMVTDTLENELIHEEGLHIIEQLHDMEDDSKVSMQTIAEEVLKGSTFIEIANKYNLKVDEVKGLFDKVLGYVEQINDGEE